MPPHYVRYYYSWAPPPLLVGLQFKYRPCLYAFQYGTNISESQISISLKLLQSSGVMSQSSAETLIFVLLPGQ